MADVQSGDAHPLYSPDEQMSAQNAVEIEPPPKRNVPPTTWDEPWIPSAWEKTMETLERELGPHIWRDCAEFEIKLGTLLESGSFRPGVSRSQFENLFTSLSNWHGWTERTNWIETLDTYRSDGTRLTVAAYNSQPSQIVIKQRVVDVDMRTETNDALRASVRLELPPSPSPPSAAAPATTHPTQQQQQQQQPYDMHVRIKTRHSFTYHYCRYDFTIVWAGSSAAIARASEPTYEVEIEFLRTAPGAREYRTTYAILTTLMKAVHLVSSRVAMVQNVTNSAATTT